VYLIHHRALTPGRTCQHERERNAGSSKSTGRRLPGRARRFPDGGRNEAFLSQDARQLLEIQIGERDAYWFETLQFERAGSMKLQSPAGVAYDGLVRNARNELRAQNPEAHKWFLLCLRAGMRRSEADVCLWTLLNPEDASIRIEPNEYIEPKHGSGGTIYVDPALMKELLSFKEQTQGSFVVSSNWEWKPSGYHPSRTSDTKHPCFRNHTGRLQRDRPKTRPSQGAAEIAGAAADSDSEGRGSAVLAHRRNGCPPQNTPKKWPRKNPRLCKYGGPRRI
jgi:hypothetical protein